MNKRAQLSQVPPSNKHKVKVAVEIGIGIAAFVLLLGMFFVFGRTTGQAYFSEEQGGIVGTAGFGGDLNSIVGKNNFNFPVEANLGSKKSVGFSFILEFPEKLSVNLGNVVFNLQSSDSANWGEALTLDDSSTITADFPRAAYVDASNNIVTTSTNRILVEHATLDFAKAISEDQILATIHFTLDSGASVLTVEEVNAGFKFEKIEVYDLDSSLGTDNIITTIIQPSGTIACPDVTMLFGELSAENQKSICRQAGIEGSCLGDINLDYVATSGNVAADLTDLTLFEYGIKARRTTPPYGSCGGQGENPCTFGTTYLCDNLELKTSATPTIKCGAPACAKAELK